MVFKKAHYIYKVKVKLHNDNININLININKMLYRSIETPGS